MNTIHYSRYFYYIIAQNSAYVCDLGYSFRLPLLDPPVVPFEVHFSHVLDEFLVEVWCLVVHMSLQY